MEHEIRHYPNLAELSEHAARFVVNLAQRRVEQTGLFTLVLSGGRTPRVLYENLALPRFSASLPWSKTHVFWGDERCVPKESPESNYGTAWKTLLRNVPLPVGNIHPMPGHVESPEEGAREYEQRLREFFTIAHGRTPAAFPSFDLILLGIGSDGHAASLFPGDPALEEGQRWTAAVRCLTAKPPVPRITLTLPVINEARNVLFLVAGNEKEPVFEAIRRDPRGAAGLYPAARIRARERVIWFTDLKTD